MLIKPLNRRDHSLSALGSQRDGEPRWTWSDLQKFCPKTIKLYFGVKLLNLIYSAQKIFNWPLNRCDHSLSALGSQRDGKPRWTWSDCQKFCPETKNQSFVLELLNLIYSGQNIFNWIKPVNRLDHSLFALGSQIKLLNRRDHSLFALGSQLDGEPRWTWSNFQDFCPESLKLYFGVKLLNFI